MNLYGYVANSPVGWVDPSGLVRGDDWRFDLRDHGGPHFQKGNLRYDADTLSPLQHRGKTPPELSKSAVRGLLKSEAYAKYQRWVKGGRVLGVVGLIVDLPSDIDRCMRAEQNGKSFGEQLQEDLISEGPYIGAGGIRLPNPYYRIGGWQ